MRLRLSCERFHFGLEVFIAQYKPCIESIADISNYRC